MRVIITGGSGLIGRALTAELIEAGYEVIILSRHARQLDGLSPAIKMEKWDGHTSQGWAHLADRSLAIINLAGENLAAGRWTEERKRRLRESRLAAGKAVVEAVNLATIKPQVIIQASAIGYYGPHGDEEITEDTQPGTDFLAKLAVEWEASTASLDNILRRVIIRTGVVLSKEGGALRRLLQPYRFFVGGRLGSGRQWVSWVHIADEVRAIRFLLEKQEARGPYNLTSPNPVKQSQLARVMGGILRRPAFLPTPAFILRFLFGEMSSVLLTGQRVLPRRLQEIGFEFCFSDLEGALRSLLGGQETRDGGSS